MADEVKPKKPTAEVAPLFRSLSALIPQDEAFRERYPTLYQVLMPIYKEGVCVRQRGVLRVYAEGSFFCASLECPTEQLQCRLMVEHLTDLYQSLESYLLSGSAQWLPGWEKQKKSRPVIDAVL